MTREKLVEFRANRLILLLGRLIVVLVHQIWDLDDSVEVVSSSSGFHRERSLVDFLGRVRSGRFVHDQQVENDKVVVQ